MATTKPRTTRRRTPLDDQQIDSLVDIICRSGDDPEDHTNALLVLLDEIGESKHPRDVAETAKRATAFRCSDQLIDAQVELIRGELL
jgi:hypothetical protein